MVAKTLTRKILLSPGPVTTTDTVKHALVVPDICHREAEFSQLIQKVRNNIKRIVHANDDYTTILFASSGTGAIEATISSVIPPTKKLLIINNGIYAERIIEIARCFHIQVIILKYSYDQWPSLETLSKILADDLDIAAVALVHHETSTGMLNPLAEISSIVASYQRLFIVDAISSFAGLSIDIKQCPIDYLIATSNKCLQGMPGISFVIAKTSSLTSNYSKGYYFDLYRQYSSLEEEGVLRFTAPVQVVYALSQAIEEYFIEGEESRFKRYQENYDRLIQGLLQLNFELMIPLAYHSKLLVLARLPEQKLPLNFNKLHDYLYERGYTIYPASYYFKNAIRLSSFGALYAKDIKDFLHQLTQALAYL